MRELVGLAAWKTVVDDVESRVYRLLQFDETDLRRAAELEHAYED